MCVSCPTDRGIPVLSSLDVGVPPHPLRRPSSLVRRTLGGTVLSPESLGIEVVGLGVCRRICRRDLVRLRTGPSPRGRRRHRGRRTRASEGPRAPVITPTKRERSVPLGGLTSPGVFPEVHEGRDRPLRCARRVTEWVRRDPRGYRGFRHPYEAVKPHIRCTSGRREVGGGGTSESVFTRVRGDRAPLLRLRVLTFPVGFSVVRGFVMWSLDSGTTNPKDNLLLKVLRDGDRVRH